MEDYKDMYPRQEEPSDPPDPREDPIGAFPEEPDWGTPPEESGWGVPPEEPEAPTFFGDPEKSETPDYGWQLPPVVPPDPPISMNRRIYTLCAVITVLIFLLCVYCIGSDILHGALNGFQADQVVVELKATEQKNPVFPRQLKTYLALMNKHLGLLLNFGQVKMVDGIERIINGYGQQASDS